MYNCIIYHLYIVQWVHPMRIKIISEKQQAQCQAHQRMTEPSPSLGTYRPAGRHASQGPVPQWCLPPVLTCYDGTTSALAAATQTAPRGGEWVPRSWQWKPRWTVWGPQMMSWCLSLQKQAIIRRDLYPDKYNMSPTADLMKGPLHGAVQRHTLAKDIFRSNTAKQFIHTRKGIISLSCSWI